MTFTFSGILQEEGGTFVEIPPDILAALGARQRPPIRVVINGIELRTTIAVYGGRSYIGVRREIREAAQVAPGDAIEVSLELDDQPRTVDLPDDLAAALAADPEARRVFEGLSFSNRKEYVAWVLTAKQSTTRQRRVAEASELLKSGRRTPGS
jgi:bacteriocin resistance YdeI/OmpD-like protein/uncharacterized protein DUF1905